MQAHMFLSSGKSSYRCVCTMLRIEELYEYSSQVRRNYATKLAELPWSEVDKNRESSFYSMKGILVHMLDVENWMVNGVIHGKSREFPRRKPAEFTNMNMLLDFLKEVEQRSREYCAKLSMSELARPVKLVTSTGQSFDLTVEECLFQSFTEQLYHLGELIALLWQDNIEPPKMQWFWNNPRKPSE